MVPPGRPRNVLRHLLRQPIGDGAAPTDLDVLFVATYTQASPLAYALSRLYQRRGTRTVVGGPHAKAFPEDCRRFFDVVVADCNEELVGDILAGHVDPGTVASAARPFDDVPTVEERMPEIRASAYYAGGRTPFAFTMIPMLASTGCPYRCDFCIDWNNPYRQLSMDRLAVDLDYVSRHAKRSFLMFHDPNFAVVFDRVFDALETVPEGRRPPYIIESSLTVLRDDRIQRLSRTNCAMVAPGVESWTDYSNKAAVGRATGPEKVELVANHFGRLNPHVRYLQGNFMFGLDTDSGRVPVELTKAFMDRTPFVWPAFNIPMPFGGTPLTSQLLAQDRVRSPCPSASTTRRTQSRFGGIRPRRLLRELYRAADARHVRLHAGRSPGQHPEPRGPVHPPHQDGRGALLDQALPGDPGPAPDRLRLPRLPHRTPTRTARVLPSPSARTVGQIRAAPPRIRVDTGAGTAMSELGELGPDRRRNHRHRSHRHRPAAADLSSDRVNRQRCAVKPRQKARLAGIPAAAECAHASSQRWKGSR